MKAAVRLVLLLCALGSSLYGQSEILPPGPAGGIPETLVHLTIAVVDGGRDAGDAVRGTVLASIEEGWHINSASPTDDFAIPTKLTLESAGIEFSPLQYPPHVERAFEFTGGEMLAVWEGDLEIPFEGRRTLGGSVSITATLYFQACNDRICLPPREKSTSVRIGADGIAVVAESEQGEPPAPPSSGGFTRLEDAPEAGSATPLFSGDVGTTLANRGLLLTLLVVFVLGLALNLTPCVYPLIPLTVAFFTSQTGGSISRRVGLASSYVLGLAAMYSALGVFSALSGRLFGAWLQQPAVLMFFAGLMIVLAASMFGAFDIQVPHFISDRAGARSGYLGAATMGLLAGIVAAPCVGPFIISLIALVGQKASVGFGFLLFFVLALGLGTPYLILGIFSSGVGSIPRSGPWMVQVKQALGFVLIAMAFYFLRPLLGDDVYRWGVGLSLLVGALFLILWRTAANRSVFALRAFLGALLLAGAAFFLWPRALGPEIAWEPYSESALIEARAAGKPVMIDFYADWCLPCKELDEKTFTDPAVIAEAERFVRLKADLTSPGDPDVARLSDQYSILGVPTIVFIATSGQESTSARLTGFEGPERFLKRIERVQ